MNREDDITTAPELVAPGRFRFTYPDGWQQGRGAFGGMVLAPMVRAAVAFAAAPERKARTLTAEIVAPVLSGPADLAVEELRAGSGTSTLAVRLIQEGELRAHAVVVLGRPRPGAPGWTPPPPPMRPWREVPPLEATLLIPTFTRHFEYRPTGPLPFSGGEPGAAGWVRPRATPAARDEAYLVALVDAWWPALFAILAAPRPMATITFTADLLGDCEGLAPDAPCFYEARLLGFHDGYAPELRALRGEDGRLLVVNHQTFVVIR